MAVLFLSAGGGGPVQCTQTSRDQSSPDGQHEQHNVTSEEEPICMTADRREELPEIHVPAMPSQHKLPDYGAGLTGAVGHTRSYGSGRRFVAKRGKSVFSILTPIYEEEGMEEETTVLEHCDESVMPIKNCDRKIKQARFDVLHRNIARESPEPVVEVDDPEAKEAADLQSWRDHWPIFEAVEIRCLLAQRVRKHMAETFAGARWQAQAQERVAAYLRSLLQSSDTNDSKKVRKSSKRLSFRAQARIEAEEKRRIEAERRAKAREYGRIDKSVDPLKILHDYNCGIIRDMKAQLLEEIYEERDEAAAAAEMSRIRAPPPSRKSRPERVIVEPCMKDIRTRRAQVKKFRHNDALYLSDKEVIRVLRLRRRATVDELQMLLARQWHDDEIRVDRAYCGPTPDTDDDGYSSTDSEAESDENLLVKLAEKARTLSAEKAGTLTPPITESVMQAKLERSVGRTTTVTDARFRRSRRALGLLEQPVDIWKTLHPDSQ